MNTTISDEGKMALHDSDIPEYMHGAIIRYFDDGISPGSFLAAVINNDLKTAIMRADDTNRHHLHDYVLWLSSYAPSGSWGRANATHDWIESFHKRPRTAEAS